MEFISRTSTTIVEDTTNVQDTELAGKTYHTKIYYNLCLPIILVPVTGSIVGLDALNGNSISGTRADGFTVVQFHGPKWSRPYPPIFRDGLVHSHDRPFAQFGMKG